MQSPDIQENLPVQPQKSLWSPAAIVWMSLLFSPIPSIVMAGINHGRVGQLQKQKLLLFFAFVGALILVLVSFRFSMLPDSESRFLRPLTVGLTIAIASNLYLSQQKLFARHIQQDGKKSSVLVPVLGSILWVAVVFGVSYGGSTIVDGYINREFERAAALLEKEDYRGAETIYKTIKSKYPDEPNVYYNLALVYANTERYELAKKELQQLLLLEPKNLDAKDLLKELQSSSEE